jgi:mono/diheme cytochrome c family protein
MRFSPAARRRAALLALVALGWSIGPAPAPRAQDGDELAQGRKLAEVHCSRCHAIGNEGTSPMEGAPPFRDLKLRYPVDDLAEALAEGIVTGHPQMPVFTFSTGEIDSLLTYLDSLE